MKPHLRRRSIWFMLCITSVLFLWAAVCNLKDKAWWWWWCSRRVTRIAVKEYGEWGGEIEFSSRDRALLVKAVRSTRDFVSSLEGAGDKYDWLLTESSITSSSTVEFSNESTSGEETVFMLTYFEPGRGSAFFTFQDGCYECSRARWRQYLTALMEPAFPGLESALDDPDMKSRFSETVVSIGVLERIGTGARPAVPALLAILGNEDRIEEWDQVMRALGAIAPGDEAVEAALRAILEDPERSEDLDILEAAREALSSMKTVRPR